MKYAISILNWIKGNEKLSLAIFVFLMAGVVIFYKAKGKSVKCEDCQPYKEMTSQLLDALKNAPTSFEPVQSAYQYASFIEADTTKPMTSKEWAKYKDSIIIATQKKLDSLKKKQ